MGWDRLRRWLTLILVVFTLLLLLPAAKISAIDQVVTFPDATLQSVIRQKINKPTGDIYQSDLQVLTRLAADILNISDLTGLEYCTKLTNLNLSNNPISNISPLTSLTSLDTLDLHNNQISNISALASLTSLTQLDLGNNQISNISPLAALTNLNWLYLRNNQIGDISPLASLPHLDVLDLTNNQISDISPLALLTTLTTLDLASNQISNISPLASLTNLAWLDLASNQISDISPLVANKGMATGVKVVLAGNPLSMTSVNTYVPQLGSLGINVVQVVTFPDAPLQAAIRHLINKPTGYIYPSDLKALTLLVLTGQNISNLTGLEYCINLSVLSLSNNQISDISPVASLPILRNLDLANNQISNIPPLTSMAKLSDLDLGNNQIIDISPLSYLTSLTKLDLANNQIIDISPLVANKGISARTTILLESNPLSVTSINTYLPQLTNLGIKVIFPQPYIPDTSIQTPTAITTSTASTQVPTSISPRPGNLTVIIVIGCVLIVLLAVMILFRNQRGTKRKS
jgi:internalin A